MWHGLLSRRVLTAVCSLFFIKLGRRVCRNSSHTICVLNLNLMSDYCAVRDATADAKLLLSFCRGTG